MSNLSENIKKYVIEKIIDLIEILLFLTILFITATKAFNYGIIIGGAVLLTGIILFYYLTRYTTKVFEEWETPTLNKEEILKYNLIDTTYNITLITLISYLLHPYTNIYILLTILIIIVGVSEYKKWKKQ